MKERYSRRFGRTEPNPFLSPETALPLRSQLYAYFWRLVKE